MVFCFHFHSVFCLFVSFLFLFYEMSLSSLYEAFRCTIFCHFFLMWKVQFLNIKKIYICLVFFNYISYMAISKGQLSSLGSGPRLCHECEMKKNHSVVGSTDPMSKYCILICSTMHLSYIIGPAPYLESVIISVSIQLHPLF